MVYLVDVLVRSKLKWIFPGEWSKSWLLPYLSWLLPYPWWNLSNLLSTENWSRWAWSRKDANCKCPSGYYGDYRTGCHDWWRSVRCYLYELIAHKKKWAFLSPISDFVCSVELERIHLQEVESTDDKTNPMFGNINLNLMKDRFWMEKVLVFSFGLLESFCHSLCHSIVFLFHGRLLGFICYWLWRNQP